MGAGAYNRGSRIVSRGADAQALEGALAATERERDAARAKLAAERDCGQVGVCAVAPGCHRHWGERVREVMADAVLRADTDAKANAAWKGLYNERNALWRDAADRLDAVRVLLEANGCDCDDDETDDGLVQHERCLACRIAAAVQR